MHSNIFLRDILSDDEFEKFFKECFTPYCAFCHYKFGLNADEAEEIVQVAFIKLWVNRSRLSPDVPVKAYLSRIIVNNCLNNIKHEKVKQKYLDHFVHQALSDVSSDALMHTDLNQLLSDIQKAISELPEQMRIIFKLSKEENLKYHEIAERLEISVKTVETQIRRALAKLRTKLSKHFFVWLPIAAIEFFEKYFY